MRVMKFTKQTTVKGGFSLIELLVAITIFVILTAVASVSYSAASRRARDGRRQSDLEAVRGALEIYRVDNDLYPFSVNFSAMATTLVGGDYLAEIPVDPRPLEFQYYYNSLDGKDYVLCAHLETVGSDSCGDFCGVSSVAACDYEVNSP